MGVTTRGGNCCRERLTLIPHLYRRHTGLVVVHVNIAGFAVIQVRGAAITGLHGITKAPAKWLCIEVL
jgi:hypothetical protein